ncbi:MAG: DUF2723 domain-containing protein [Anaerolineae bacterium]|nr:DUF2723 domain-containing protein [Anaerolineae bacterium]
MRKAFRGAIVGLFLTRLGLEAIGSPLPGWVIVLVGGIALTLGPVLWARFVRRAPCWPFVPLWLYLLWPSHAPQMGLSVALLATALWLLTRRWELLNSSAELFVDSVLFLIAFSVYGATVARDVLPADSGEFQLVSALLGVAHPPGYPLYTLVGHLFIRLAPAGIPALRLNAMSAVLAAVTVLLMARAACLWARSLGASPLLAIACGLATALTLGTSTTFWAQATTANIRMPTLFFGALALRGLARFALHRNDRSILLAALALGLGIGHHPSLAFVGLFFALYAVTLDPGLLHPRRGWRPAIAFLLAGLLPQAYLPIQGARGAPLAPSDLDTLPGFLWHVLARGFAGDMFAFANPQDLPHRLALVPTLFAFQFRPPILIAAVLGVLALLKRDRRLFLMLTGSWALHTFVTITYRAPQTVEYLMPAYLPLALAVGLLPAALEPISPRWARQIPAVICALVLWTALLNGVALFPEYAELAKDTSVRRTAGDLLKSAPPDALILADWHWATPMWYLQQVEGLRPDVEVRYVYPIVGEEYAETWFRHVREALPGRPVLLTHFYEFPGYTTEPWGMGFRVSQRPMTAPTAPLVPKGLTFAGGVRLVGYSLRGPLPHPGQSLEVILAWQATKPLERPPSFTVRLVDERGQHRAQADRRLGTDSVPGEVRFERLVLPLYPTLSPGHYSLRLGAYTVTERGFEVLPAAGGEDFVLLTELEIRPADRAPFTLHRWDVPFSNGPILIGTDYDRTISETLRVYLHWRGPAAGGTVVLRSADGSEASSPLPALPAGAYQTVVVDLPGTVRGLLRLSLVDDQGQQARGAGPWGWPVSTVALPVPKERVRFVLLGDAMAMAGARAFGVRAGQEAVVEVVLVGLRPLTEDLATSVRLVDEAGRFLGAHDCQPALGTVPTLKWVRGSVVRDRHLIPVPEDWAGGEVRAIMVAYERFRMAPVPPMDERYQEGVLLLP